MNGTQVAVRGAGLRSWGRCRAAMGTPTAVPCGAHRSRRSAVTSAAAPLPVLGLLGGPALRVGLASGKNQSQAAVG